MASPQPPSASLVRTAKTEIDRIDRSLATIEQRRMALLSQLAELDEEVEAYSRRRGLLEELVEVEQVTPRASAAPTAVPRRALKGAELRRVAARLLWQAQRDREIHYREWFERVVAAGYAIGGKDPVASFLTNVRDSPAVRRGTSQGLYRLDPGQETSVRDEIGEIEAELMDLERSIDRAYADSSSDASTEALRSHRDDLKQRLKRLEANSAELRYVFAEDATDLSDVAHASGALQAA